MIAFVCKQCGKRHERPDQAAGSLVFCACGQGNRVPWENAQPLTPLPVPAETTAPSGVLDAIPLDAESPRVVLSHRREQVARDPDCCFNHQDIAAVQTCAACGENFCADCLVVLQGASLCGPCKNFRIRGLQRPPRLSILAVVAFIGALLTGPLGFCLVSVAAGFKTPGFGFLGVVPPVIVLLMGARALREIEANPNVSGRALAMTAVVTALVGGMFLAILPFIVQRGIE